MRIADRPVAKSSIAVVAATGVMCAAMLAALWPQARSAAALLWAQDDPVALADLQLGVALPDAAAAVGRIDEALTANDAELAQSFVDLATARGLVLPADVVTRVAAAVAAEQSAGAMARRFATGLVTGEADDLASLSGTVAGDLFVFGDVRDVVREGKRLAVGEEPDRLVLGLAAAGLAVTAATYVSVGGATPVRAGLTLVKDARKAGRLGAGLAGWAGRSAREVVDAPRLQRVLETASMSRPGESVAALRTAFRAEKAEALLRVAKDVGRIGEKAGTRGALEALHVAEGPKDMARAARLAEKKGSQTRAIFKLLGRGALLLASGAFNLTLWLFSALMMLFGIVSSIKSAAERTTLWWLRRAKARRARRAAAAAAAASAAMLSTPARLPRPALAVSL
ncbi:hypothetical protein [Bradyrhizobium sp. 2TAF24]|uniref:hypothetical protein n=1 Tax=Bradyrhizobium sp. 2TAF24 TaxID=3233011 RepID=UPI003F907AA1